MEDDSSAFVCLICNRRLKHKYSLERHINVVHGAQRPFHCSCGKFFATKEQLTRHVNSKHTHEKPYPCLKGCDKSFASYTARSYHYSAIHDQVKFSCPFVGCQKSYSAKVHLVNHLKKPHPPLIYLLNLIILASAPY